MDRGAHRVQKVLTDISTTMAPTKPRVHYAISQLHEVYFKLLSGPIGAVVVEHCLAKGKKMPLVLPHFAQ